MVTLMHMGLQNESTFLWLCAVSKMQDKRLNVTNNIIIKYCSAADTPRDRLFGTDTQQMSHHQDFTNSSAKKK